MIRLPRIAATRYRRSDRRGQSVVFDERKAASTRRRRFSPGVSGSIERDARATTRSTYVGGVARLRQTTTSSCHWAPCARASPAASSGSATSSTKSSLRTTIPSRSAPFSVRPCADGAARPAAPGRRRLIVHQNRWSDGFLVVKFETPGHLRGYASYDPERLRQWRRTGPTDGALTAAAARHDDRSGRRAGKPSRHRGTGRPRPRRGALDYFRQFGAAPDLHPPRGSPSVRRSQRRDAVALALVRRWPIVQHVPAAGGENEAKSAMSGEERDASLVGEHDETGTASRSLQPPSRMTAGSTRRWRRAPADPPFQRGRRARFALLPLEAKCRCSHQRIGSFLEAFSAEDAKTSAADGAITVQRDLLEEL